MADENKEYMPRLRFPEFVATPWKISTLDECCEFLDSRRKPITMEDRRSGPYPYYGASGIIDYVDDYIFDEKLLLVGEDGAKWGRFEKTAFIATGKYWVNNHAHVLKVPIYIDTLLENYFYYFDFSGLITGAAPPKLTLAKLKKLRISLPGSKAEQQKIADCLSSLDELIQAHEQKRNALLEHKKGLMQRLFPAEGETTPRWRFPEFRKANTWEQKSLGQVCKTFSGGTPSTSNKAYYGGDIPFIRSAEINKTKTELFLTELGLKNSSAKLVKEGDILLALYGANSGEVAISKLSGAINQAILCLRSNQNNSFIFHYLFFKKDYFISKYLQGGQGNFSAEIVKSISIPLPSIPEQQKIADCLSSLDARIEAQEAKITSLREHKQGLMQRLFPQSL